MKAAIISIVLSCLAGAAAAGDANSDFATDALLPPEVLARIIELERHGDRFALAIRMIRAEALKPDWGFDGCGHAIGTEAPGV